MFMSLEAAEKLLHDKLSMAGDEARVIFRSFDSDKSGSISTAELRAVLEDRFHIHLKKRFFSGTTDWHIMHAANCAQAYACCSGLVNKLVRASMRFEHSVGIVWA